MSPIRIKVTNMHSNTINTRPSIRVYLPTRRSNLRTKCWPTTLIMTSPCWHKSNQATWKYQYISKIKQILLLTQLIPRGKPNQSLHRSREAPIICSRCKDQRSSRFTAKSQCSIWWRRVAPKTVTMVRAIVTNCTITARKSTCSILICRR